MTELTEAAEAGPAQSLPPGTLTVPSEVRRSLTAPEVELLRDIVRLLGDGR